MIEIENLRLPKIELLTDKDRKASEIVLDKGKLEYESLYESFKG